MDGAAKDGTAVIPPATNADPNAAKDGTAVIPPATNADEGEDQPAPPVPAASAEKKYRKAEPKDLKEGNIEFFESDDGIKPKDPNTPLTPPPTEEQLNDPDSKYLVEDKPPIPSSNSAGGGVDTAVAAADIVFDQTELTDEDRAKALEILLAEAKDKKKPGAAAPANGETGANAGGRRRTKRKGRKGSKKSKKGAKKSKKSSQSNQSQNGGRRSRKNHRKHSHRRKH